jgi:hypothetical protein
VSDSAWGIKGFPSLGDCPKVRARSGKGQDRLMCGGCNSFSVELLRRNGTTEMFCWCCGAYKAIQSRYECSSPRAEAMLILRPVLRREQPKEVVA